MRCAEARDRLVALPASPPAPRAGAPEANQGAAPGDALARHVASCAGCAAFAERLATYRAALPSQRSEHAPGPDFAARVVTQLPDTAELLGWAAVRLLPAAFALAIACSWYGLSHGPGLSYLLLHPDDPLLLTYVALGPEEGE